jgi:hypothetical protein
MSQPFTKISLAAVDDAAPPNGFGGSGRVKLDAEVLDVKPLDSIRVAPAMARAFEAGEDGLEFLVFGAHHPGDGEPVEDPWTTQ